MALRYRNILIIGFSLQGTVLNMISSVFIVVRYNSDGICVLAWRNETEVGNLASEILTKIVK